jgi:hypothetical protein
MVYQILTTSGLSDGSVVDGVWENVSNTKINDDWNRVIKRRRIDESEYRGLFVRVAVEFADDYLQ